MKKCYECGNTENLIKLQSGIFCCLDCLDNIGKEQEEIKNYIQDYLKENFQIENPNTQIKTLQSIIAMIKLENGLYTNREMRKVKSLAKKMFGNIEKRS